MQALQVKAKKHSNVQEVHNVKRNILLYTLTKLDITAMVIPVIVKVWTEAGLNFNQMLLLQGIFALSVLVFEVPSGTVSDTMNRKVVLVLGHTIRWLAVTVYAFGNSFATFACAEILFGMGLATISGTDSSLLYDSMFSANKEGEYKKVVGRAASLSFLTSMIALPISGLISLYNIRLPLIIISISFGIFTISSVFFRESERQKADGLKQATGEAVRTLFRTPILFALLIASFSYSVAQRIVFWAYQPRLFDIGINTFEIGVIFAGMNLVAAIGSVILNKLDEKNEKTIIFVFLIIETFNAVMIWYCKSLFILFSMFLVQLVRGARTPITNNILQSNATSSQRATLVSLYSSIGNLLYFIVSIIYTIVNLDYENTLLSVVLFSLLLTMLYITTIQIQKKQQIIVE